MTRAGETIHDRLLMAWARDRRPAMAATAMQRAKLTDLLIQEVSEHLDAMARHGWLRRIETPTASGRPLVTYEPTVFGALAMEAIKVRRAVERQRERGRRAERRLAYA